MGSCFGKHSPKDFAIPFVEEKKASLQKKQPRQAAKAEKQEKDVPSVAAAVSPSSKANHESKQQQLPSPAPLPAAASTDFQKPPSASLPVQKPSPSPSLFPDPSTLPPSAQAPRKKHSGEFTLNPLQKPSSPCKPILHNMPPSPVQKKSAHRNEEEDCKFPSSARNQWLSQAEPLTLANKASGTEPPTLAAGAGENVTAILSKGSGEESLILTRKASSAEGLILSGKGSGVEIPTLTSKAPAAETLTLTGKAFSSRTNSFSRDPSPVDLSRDKARCSSPLKRSPSVKDHAAADGPRLTRSSSGKASSPNRSGLHASERHDSMKARPLHKQSLSKEFLADTSAAFSAHKRSASRDSASDFSAEIIRKPSPPKKIPVLVASSSLSASDANRLTSKRPATPVKENSASHKPAIQEPSSMGRSGRTPGQWSSGAAVHDSDNPSNTTNRNAKRKEKSPLRTCNGMTALHSSTRITNRNADLSINSDTMSVSHFALRGKDAAATTKKPGTRPPLREISDNSTCHAKSTTSKQAAKQNARIPQDEIPFQKETSTNALPLQEEVTKNHGRYDEKAMLDLVVDDFTERDKDPLEVKAENLVMGGRSVMSAFKALEEYRLKYSNLNLESCKGIDEDVWYSRQQPLATDKETLSQPLQVRGMEKSAKKENLQQQAEELPRSRSTKKSCEPFLFPDVQSLLMSENEGMQLEGGVTMPASLSKACSILRAVADLNMGTSVYPKKKETQDEIERPNLLSFQFGEGDSHGVTMS